MVEHGRRMKVDTWPTPPGFKPTDGGRKILEEDPIDKMLKKTKVPESLYTDAWALD